MRKIKEAYLGGDISVKGTILKFIGSEFIVKDKKFFVKNEPIFEVRTKGIEGTLIQEEVFELLKDNKRQDFDRDFEVLNDNQSSWLPGQDSNLQPGG